jgi:hypothetical protein
LRLAPRKLGYCFDHASFPVEYLRQADPQRWPEAVRVRWRERLTWWHGLLWTVAAFAFISGTTRTLRETLVEGALRGIVAGLAVWAWQGPPYGFWVLVVALVVSAWPRRSAPASHPVGRFVVGYLVVFLLLHIVFFGEDRYHVPLAPWSAMLAAAVWRPSRSKSRLLRRTGT